MVEQSAWKLNSFEIDVISMETVVKAHECSFVVKTGEYFVFEKKTGGNSYNERNRVLNKRRLLLDIS